MPTLPDALKTLIIGRRGLAALSFVVAGLVFLLVAWAAAAVIENRSRVAVHSAFLTEGLDWATVETDGLRVTLTGTAPTEAARFRAMNLAGTVVDTARLQDALDVTPTRPVEAPRFTIEMLRNDDGLQLIGLLPEGPDREALTEAAAALVAPSQFSNMLETAAYPAPEGWDQAMAFGIAALKALPRAKISVAADGVGVTAIARSDQEKADFEVALAAIKPEGIPANFEVTAPRPVLTPFTLRFVSDAQGARFDACAADSEAARAQILEAAASAGADVSGGCTIGLGVPTPSWGRATVAGIAAVSALKSATITFSDADVTLQAGPEVAQGDFDRVVGEFRANLPDVFSLDAKLEKVAAANAGPAEVTATLAESGQVELRGRLTDELTQAAVESLAAAAFGQGKLRIAARLDPDLPDGWPIRVLAGVEALAELHHGSLLVRPDLVEVKGVAGSTSAKARIAGILSERLGKGQSFKVDVTYDESFDPLAAIPTPTECAERVTLVLAKQKITFAPGSAEIDGNGAKVIGGVAAALENCGPISAEIAGHTDAQGSEGGNLALSQARAEAVLLALQGRQVDVSALQAKGYGEGVPIADNGTDAGREANRRIEFTLLGGFAVVEGNSPAEQQAAMAPAAETAAEGGHDFSADTSPSIAPKDKTIKPPARPEGLGDPAQDG